jgi:hypothetical protein
VVKRRRRRRRRIYSYSNDTIERGGGNRAGYEEKS